MLSKKEALRHAARVGHDIKVKIDHCFVSEGKKQEILQLVSDYAYYSLQAGAALKCEAYEMTTDSDPCIKCKRG